MVPKGCFILGLVAVLLILLTQSALAQSGLCLLHDTCGKCLSSDVSCSWCIDRDYDMRKPRCLTKPELVASNCSRIYENRPTAVKILDDRPNHDFGVGSMDAVQIQPQLVQMTLRKMQTKTIKMVYRPAKNYPLDLYYLMDMTYSMTDDKETLVSVGKDLAQTLQNLTENYRLAFGSFVDKPAMPFMPIGKEEKNPCALERGVCEKTYGFRHRFSLNKNVSQFIQNVNETEISGNLDNLEGGLDALMQILVCGSNIGWSNQSRKIIVFASDGLMHFAGDGLLAGVVKKHDKECHLSEDGEYLASLQLDYPSLEEIYHELLRRKVNIIFAVTQDVEQLYYQIHGLMHEVSRVGVLKMDSSNVLPLVAEGYADFVRRVQFFDNAPSHIQVKYRTKCGIETDNYRSDPSCDNIEIGKEYEFIISLTLLEYPDDANATRNSIAIEDASSLEFLQIDIDIEEECPCERDEEGEMQSWICNQRGEFKCGMCVCESGWTGKTCECDLFNYSSGKELEKQCRLPLNDFEDDETSQLGPICSDNGECVCGQCDCNYGFSGKYCNCRACPYHKGQQCGGSEHGICDCGACECNDGWSGERCSCSTSNSTCLSPKDGQLCSGNGICDCGQCKCNANYYGTLCEMSSSQENTLCSYYEPCVKCLLEPQAGIECSDVRAHCSAQDGSIFLFQYFDDISDSPVSCMIRITDTAGKVCEHNFAYHVDSVHQSHLKIRNHKCEYTNVAATGGIIIAATFLMGCLVLLAIRSWYTILDKREFAKFENERLNQTEYRYESPIYNSPNRKYEVPQALLDENEIEMKRFSTS